jgi:hypothetical protein
VQGVDWFTVIVAVASILFGAFITGFYSWWYYGWGSKDFQQKIEGLTQRYEELNQDLRQEVLSTQQDLRNINDRIVYMIQLLADAGLIQPRRNEEGKVLFPFTKDLDLRWQVKDFETEERERAERERAEREEKEQEISRRPFRGPLRRFWQRIRRA